MLGARRPRRAARPALALAAAARAPARAAAGRRRARAARRHDRLLGLHDQRGRGEAVVDASGLAVEPIEGWAQFRHPTPAGVPADAAARPRHERLLHRPAPRGRKIARVAWRDWVRTVEIEPSLYAADFWRLGEQIEHAPARRRPRLPLRRRRRAFRPAGDDRPGRAALDRAARSTTLGGRIDCHLMVDDPAHHFQELAESGGDSVTFHVEAVDDVGAVDRARRASTGSRSASPSTRRRRSRWPPRPPTRAPTSASACRSSPATRARSSWRTRYERIARTRELRRLLRPGRRRRQGGERPRRARGRGGPARRRHRHLRLRGSAAGLPAAGTSARMSLRAGAGARRERGRGRAYPKPTVGAVVVADGEIVGEGGDRGGRPPRRGRRARGGGRARARRDALRDDGAVRPPRARRRPASTRSSRPGSRASSPARSTRTPRRRAGSSGCARRASRSSSATASRRGARTRRGGRGSRSGGRSSPTRRRSRSTAASPCRASAGSRARSRAGSCTSCAPRPMPSPSGWGRCVPRIRGSTLATSRRRGSRAGSRSGAGRSRKARSSSCARPARGGAARARGGRRPVAAARGRPDARDARSSSAGLVDKLLLFVAPTLAGDGPCAVSGLEVPLRLTHLTSTQVGEDVLLEAYLREP